MGAVNTKALQRAINQRARARHLPLIAEDGVIGPLTIAAGRRVAWLMGVKLGPGRHSIPQRAREVLVGGKRTPVELARARHRKSIRPLRLRAWDQARHLADLKVTEQGGNNHGAWVEKIIRANGGVPGEPWCGDFVAAVYLWAGAKSVVRPWASVNWLWRTLTPVKSPKRGHIVTYTFDHTGLFGEWQTSRRMLTIEGNTGNTGAVSDSITGGDGVKVKLRDVSLVSGFRRVLR